MQMYLFYVLQTITITIYNISHQHCSYLFNTLKSFKPFGQEDSQYYGHFML